MSIDTCKIYLFLALRSNCEIFYSCRNIPTFRWSGTNLFLALGTAAVSVPYRTNAYSDTGPLLLKWYREKPWFPFPMLGVWWRWHGVGRWTSYPVCEVGTLTTNTHNQPHTHTVYNLHTQKIKYTIYLHVCIMIHLFTQASKFGHKPFIIFT